jgi:large subunit ribosomal protein L10
MALSKEKKHQVVADVVELLNKSKMTVLAKYQGTTVKAMQDFRRQASANGTIIKIAKNRLVKQAFSQSKYLKDLNTDILEGMLLYAFNGEDEVAPAQAIANFSKEHPSLEFVGAFNASGKFLNSDEVKELAALPGRDQLIAVCLASLESPLNEVFNGISGNIHGLLDSLTTKLAN